MSVTILATSYEHGEPSLSFTIDSNDAGNVQIFRKRDTAQLVIVQDKVPPDICERAESDVV